MTGAMLSVDKAQLLSSVQASLQADLTEITDSQRKTIAGATHAESRAENDKDTRALESTYLARGLAERVEQLREAVVKLAALELRVFGPDDPVALGAVVVLEAEEGEARFYFLAPAAGGMEVQIEGRQIRVVTPSSPVGQSVLGRYVDDTVQIQTPKGSREMTISALT